MVDVRELKHLSQRVAAKVGQKISDYGADGELKPWDRQFLKWIKEAQSRGMDPNDVGDERWGSPLDQLERHYFPLIQPEHTVMELGPGSGRYTRHLVDRCERLVLVDYSHVVCDWMEQCYQGRSDVQIVRAQSYALTQITAGSIDTIVANGVFEHIDLEGFMRYFQAFERALKPGGRGCFNFNNIVAPQGLDRFIQELPAGFGERSIFRFYHPETVSTLCKRAGLRVEKMHTSEGRFAFITFAKS